MCPNLLRKHPSLVYPRVSRFECLMRKDLCLGCRAGGDKQKMGLLFGETAQGQSRKDLTQTPWQSYGCVNWGLGQPDLCPRACFLTVFWTSEASE